MKVDYCIFQKISGITNFVFRESILIIKYKKRDVIDNYDISIASAYIEWHAASTRDIMRTSDIDTVVLRGISEDKKKMTLVYIIRLV